MDTHQTRVDINVDAGEAYGRWHLEDVPGLLKSVSSVNLACGFHAGDPRTMLTATRRAAEAGVAIGAHPGFPDLVGFGRRDLAATPTEIFADVLYQLGALAGFVRHAGTQIRHVKAHGALYLRMMRDNETAEAIFDAVATFDRSLPVMVLAGPAGEQLGPLAESRGLRLLFEAFPDRGYLPDGSLAPRSHPDALVLDPDRAAERAVRMVTSGTVRAIDGSESHLAVDTLCVHGDNPTSVLIAAAIRRALESAGIRVRAA